MEGFRTYFEATELEKNLKDTLDKIPASHRRLVQGYTFHWEAGSTLKGDDDHVGVIDPKKKTVTIASPWNYGREFTLLHELGHLVYHFFVSKELRKEFAEIVKWTKDKLNQNSEELFCMAYANHFAKNQIAIHDHKEWDDFVKKIVALSKHAEPNGVPSEEDDD